MKTLLFIVLLIAFSKASLITFDDNDRNVQFEYDIHKDSPIGIVMKGKFDPINNVDNSISTFLRIAKTYIPILENLSEKSNKLTFERVWRVNFAGIDVTLDLFVQVLIGWRVENVSTQTDYYNVTYVPFIWGWLNTKLNGTTWPGVGSYKTDLEFIRAYSPVGLRVYKNKICYSGEWNLLPVTFVTQMNVALWE